MDDLIRRSDAIRAFCVDCKGQSKPCEHSDTCKTMGVLRSRRKIPAVEPCAEPKQGENIGTDYAECDQFICSECGIHLQEWVRIDEDDYDDGIVHEYEFRFCPNCGAKMKGSDDELQEKDG